MKQPIRILQIIPSAYRGSGILQVVLNWHKNIDRTKIQFDYLFSKPAKNSARAEIERLGGRIYELPHPYEHPVQFLRESYQFFKERRYHTVHSHMTNLNLFFYPLAKWFGAKNIIQHAHGTKWSDKKLNGWRNYLMLHAVWFLITHKIVCSQAAGKAYFGKNFLVVNNGIDVDKFSFNSDIGKQKRKELGLENNFVIGHVGRFSSEKNHAFLIEIFEEIVKKEINARLVLIGDGSTEKDIHSLVRNKHLEDRVLFLGVRRDVAQLLSALDVFVLPSFHEGMPVVGVEAQTSGLPCVFSDGITSEICLLPTTSMLSLQAGPKVWADKILSLRAAKRSNGKQYIQQKGFDIVQTTQQIQNFYLNLRN